MRKNLKLKTSREFLKKYFPENILPWKTLSNKDIRILREKEVLFKRTKKRIKKLEKFLKYRAKSETKTKQLRVNPFNTTPCFLFSSDQIKNDLLRTQSYNKPSSDFLLKIKEKKKFSILYGKISRKFFKKAYLQAVKDRGRLNENLIIQFETRLDTLLYRICFSKTIAAARQSINHNLISVNGIIINVSSYQVKPGDIISVDKNKKKKFSDQLLNVLKKNINHRRFRFFLSVKTIEKRIGDLIYPTPSVFTTNSSFSSFLPTKSFGKNLKNLKGSKIIQYSRRGDSIESFFNNTLRLKEKKLIKIYKRLERLTIKIKKQLYTKKKRYLYSRRGNLKKQLWFVETLLRLKHLMFILQETFLKYKNWQPLSKKQFQFVLQEKIKHKFLFLQLKRLMYRLPSRYNRLLAMRNSPMKPLNVEVSFKIMSAVVLYHPQKIVFPATINIELLSRSIAQK